MTSPIPNRREFLQVSAAAGVAAASITAASAQQAGQVPVNSGGIPMRPLGKTGQNVSLICLGGHSATNPKKMSEAESLKLIRRAVDEGITFMDNCWDYHDGEAEERMGKALAEGGRRDKVFLMTKVCGRTAKDARSNLEDSLRRLKTDRIDLWQFHEMVYDNDPDWVFADDGAIHAGLKALKDGNADERLGALPYLRRTPNEGVIKSIYHSIRSDDPELREAAYQTIWELASGGATLPNPAQFGLG